LLFERMTSFSLAECYKRFKSIYCSQSPLYVAYRNSILCLETSRLNGFMLVNIVWIPSFFKILNFRNLFNIYIASITRIPAHVHRNTHTQMSK
jgi:hypothetical protein